MCKSFWVVDGKRNEFVQWSLQANETYGISSPSGRITASLQDNQASINLRLNEPPFDTRFDQSQNFEMVEKVLL